MYACRRQGEKPKKHTRTSAEKDMEKEKAASASPRRISDLMALFLLFCFFFGHPHMSVSTRLHPKGARIIRYARHDAMHGKASEHYENSSSKPEKRTWVEKLLNPSEALSFHWTKGTPRRLGVEKW